MAVASEQEIYSLLEKTCVTLEEASLDYLVYGSAAYVAVTGDRVDIHDLDIMVRQSDFGRLASVLGQPGLALKPIITPFTIHANSLVHQGMDGKPFDISLDSWIPLSTTSKLTISISVVTLASGLDF
jgi:hypothetical protein